MTFTAVTFAPVQGFISSSRKLRDLYGSSLLLSVLAKAIVDDATNRGFEVLSPALVNTARGTPNLLVISGLYKKGYGRDALQTKWGEILMATRLWIESNLDQFDYHWEPVWKQWHHHAWEYFHAQAETITEARQQLALAKQARAWSGINWTGESSTLAGCDAIARPRLGLMIDPRKVSNAEEKAEADTFIQALKALTPLGEPFAGKGEQPSVPELVKRLVTYPVVAKRAFADEKLLDVLPQRFDAIANSATVVWFMADGDEVGKYLEKQAADTPENEASQLKSFSNAMRSWAEGLYNEVPEITQQMGTVVYAGGDDLLGALHDLPGSDETDIAKALAPAHLMDWLKKFPDLWLQHEQDITVSMGLVFVSGQVPQREALQHVRLAEASAKAHGRNRFALRLLFSGGQSIEWVCRWTELPRVLEGYRDREQRSGDKAYWGHLASDVATLQGRRALGGDGAGSKAVAEALWAIYFPNLVAPKDLAQPLGDWLSDLAQVLSRLLKPVRQKVHA
jgi:CRISPR-associated protein Cmr2